MDTYVTAFCCTNISSNIDSFVDTIASTKHNSIERSFKSPIHPAFQRSD